MSKRTDALREELLALRSVQGLVNPVTVVRWARSNPGSHLHGALCWDDAIAAERYRLWQVRELISVHIVDVSGGPQFVSLSIDRQVGGYRTVAEVMGRTELRDVMMADALAELERVQARYQKLTELAAVWAEAGKVRERRPRRAAKAKEVVAAA